MFVQVFAPRQATLLHNRERLQSKARILTRLITLIATVSLAAAIVFRFPSDFRMEVCIIVSVAAIALIARSLFVGKLMWTLFFFGVLGVFTPFHPTHFHTRHGDAGALSGLADHPWKIYQSIGA
jgi:hypothetical protein